MTSYPHNCTDRTCGALDCHLCRPLNDAYREWCEARDRWEDMREDEEESRKANATHDGRQRRTVDGVVGHSGCDK